MWGQKRPRDDLVQFVYQKCECNKEQKSEMTCETKKERLDVVGVTMKIGEVPFRKWQHCFSLKWLKVRENG